MSSESKDGERYVLACTDLEYENSQCLLDLFEKLEKNTDIFASHENGEGSRGVAPLPELRATIPLE